MENNFNLPSFISRHVTSRTESLFAHDIQKNRETLTECIAGKALLVIGDTLTFLFQNLVELELLLLL